MNIKPLNQKNYGSIPHLPNSRIGVGDHHCHQGQADICLKARKDKTDTIIVQEKLDGSNVGIAKIKGKIYSLTRAGYEATTSKYEQHHLFAHWVREQYSLFDDLLEEGERICGEWLAQAHSTRYNLNGRSPFVAFDIMQGDTRVVYGELYTRCFDIVAIPPVISIGDPISVEKAIEILGTYGHYGALDPVEGLVYRVEKRNKKNGVERHYVDFLAKYVRPDKEDGIYLKNQEPVWNWRP